ncbi:MAG: DUF2791 family P-loop domain-containing protein [Acidimicrobiia bacterium]|nr:DUF2791 family P-loop domain-containing protein [Acidimicrobiia bacterium]
MKIKVLGPLEVLSDDGAPVDLGRRKQRALLAMLVVEANQVVPLDRLVDLLWAEEPPARAMSSIQTYVSNLRRLLEPRRLPRMAAEVIVSQSPGYVLRIETADLDASSFRSLADRGGRLLSEGDPVRAREALVEALGLWRGPAFADFAGESFAVAEAGRLDELRLAATENRLEADLALGNHTAAAAELEALVADHPLRERLCGLFMVALYRSGRQVEALRAFQDVREGLADLGLEPGPALRSIEADVLDHAPSLAPAASPAASPARGPDRTSSGRSGQASLVGREPELAALARALDAARAGQATVVLMSGEPGIGKTRLAEELAQRAEDSGFAVAWGHCFDDIGAPPFWPWVQIVRTLLVGMSADRVADVLGDGINDIAQIVPDVKAAVGAVGVGAPGTRPPESALRVVQKITTPGRGLRPGPVAPSGRSIGRASRP